MLIPGPLQKCEIVYRYVDRKVGDFNTLVVYEDRFVTIPELAEYFKRFPNAGALVGYGKRKYTKDWAISATLHIEWQDAVGTTVSKEFANVKEFVAFIEEHPTIASTIAYEKKKK